MNHVVPPTPPAGLRPPGRAFRDRRATPRPEPGLARRGEAGLPLAQAWCRHWPEYAIEAGFLCAFLLVTGLASLWLEASGWPARRLALAGVSGGLLMAMIYSPWGRRSGSHLNPAITLAYLRLGKIGPWDALFYTLAQLAGALVAVLLLRGVASPGEAPATLAGWIGRTGDWAAFAIDGLLAACAMLLILWTSNHPAWFRFTGVLYGALVMLIVASIGPLSGFGLNVARLLAVDVSGGTGGLRWLDLLPPLLGMALGVEAHGLIARRRPVLCAKLAHNTHGRCIFRCQHPWQRRALTLEVIRRSTDAPASTDQYSPGPW